eukprot:gene13988-3006_t
MSPTPPPPPSPPPPSAEAGVATALWPDAASWAEPVAE